MKLLVIGAGMMGSSAAYDMARCARVESVTLADADTRRSNEAAKRINKMVPGKKVEATGIDASSRRDAVKKMRGHDGTLSAVPYFYNLGLAEAAIDAKSHFADLGGNNVVVRKELALDKKAAKKGVGIAPDCGLSPGMASILGGELMRRIGGKADALKIYVGGLPQDPKPPFNYQLVFSVEGLINEYCEPARILRNGKLVMVEPLTEIELFKIPDFPELEAFHTSGGTSTMPETYGKNIGECFEKTLRYPGHVQMIRSLYDLGLFSSKKRKIGKMEIAPRAVMSDLMVEKFSGDKPDVTVMRVEAHRDGHVAAFTMIDKYDPATKLTSMMRTTAWPASVVLQMMVNGEITKRGAVLQERDVPAKQFLSEMAARGVELVYTLEGAASTAAAR
ncbi:MAG: saccharopine dehydrogenase C-terminal domain-containing protein [Terriglobia bacterium]|jgi:lysine 6-dehydrogenase|nr:saccharopine dehydrogenase C-terminal domain-containing protein [Terriglobia bacterium]